MTTTVTHIGASKRCETISGWGRTSPSFACIAQPAANGDLDRLISRGTSIARGEGRSYGDAAQNSGGNVIGTRRLNRIEPVDPHTGLINVGAGVTLDRLMRRIIPQGWFVSVTPGTRQVTIGGAIAADIHGKNHHHDGSFCQHVTSITVRTGRGIDVLTPQTTPAEFWATAGGMGLTGVIIEATLQLRRIETAYITCRTERYRDLDSLMSGLRTADGSTTYTVAWIDGLNPVPRLGRGLVLRGEHATRAELESDGRHDRPLAFSPRGAKLPPVPVPLITPQLGKLFNRAWYRHHKPGSRIETIGSFFHPLDAVENWNLLYGRRGFLQWQIAVPDRSGPFIADALLQLARVGAGSFLSVLKRFGPASPGPLSFPIAGWTLAVDLPLNTPSLASTLADLDRQTASHGGRVYLAKDGRLDPAHLEQMYPRLDEWRAVRAAMDPDNSFRSDLSQRLDLVTRATAQENAA